MDLAKFLYAAWLSSVDSDNPQWDDLTPETQDSWQAMAMLVGTYNGPPASDG